MRIIQPQAPTAEDRDVTVNRRSNQGLKSDISETIDFETAKFAPVKPWIVPAKPLQTKGFDDSSIQSRIRESIERFDINNLAHRPAIQNLLCQLNCRDFAENRDFIWLKSVIKDEQILQKAALIVSRLKANYKCLDELQDYKVEEINSAGFNYSLVKISARNANQQPMLEIDLHHSHFKYSPVLAATNEQLTLERIDFIESQVTNSNITSRKYFVQERRMPIKRDRLKIILSEAHERISISNLGIGNGDTLRCNDILKSLLIKNQADTRILKDY